jgi:hypothetical protein
MSEDPSGARPRTAHREAEAETAIEPEHEPAYIGDTIRVEGEIESLDPVDDAGVVTCGWRVRNERDELLARAKLKITWRRSGSGELSRGQASRTRR